MEEATKIVLRTQEEIALWSQVYAASSAALIGAVKGTGYSGETLAFMIRCVGGIADDSVHALRERLRTE